MKTNTVRIKLLLVAFIVLGISACATPITSSVDTAQHADLGTFKTYAWITDRPLISSGTSHAQLLNPVNEDRIRSSIDEELGRKGYRKVSIEDADLAVAFSLGARDRVVVRNSYDDFGYRYYGFNSGFSRFGSSYRRIGRFNRFSRFGGYGNFGPTTTIRTFTEGTLVVDVFDNMEKEALWHGAASKRISRKENGSELISEAVDTLLGQFPDSTAMAEMASDLSTS